MPAVCDPLGYLRGDWTIERQLTDVRAGLVGDFVGRASLVPDGAGGLSWRETGELAWAGVRRPAGRELALAPTSRASTVEVKFSDGRHFHELDLSSGSTLVVHDCGEDRYEGRYVVLDPDTWTASWDVAGPRKTMRIRTRYQRVTLA